MKNNYLFLLLVGLVSFVFDGKAQVNLQVTAGGTSAVCQAGAAVTLNCTYVTVNGTTGYTVSSISPNSPFSTNPPFSTSLTTDDDWSQVIDLKGAGATPFNFCFFGNTYSKCLLNTNGVISFSIGSGPSAVPGGVYTPGGGAGYTLSQLIPNNPGTSNAPYLNAIHGVFQDTDPSNSPIAATNINYYVNGTYPNRAFILSMNEVPNFSCSTVRQSSQVVMYEGTNIIDVYVIKRDNSCSWQGGRAVLGIQDNSGTVGFTPPGRNTGSWAVPAATPEAWRFKPNAGAAVPVTLVWKDQLGNVVGTGASPTVYPTTTTTYTVEATYTICGLNYTVSDDVTVTITDIQTGTPSNITDPDCNSLTGYDLTVNTAPVMAALDPSQYIISYHTTLASANGANNAEIPAGSLSNFISTGQPIWVAVEDFFSSFACRKVQQFNLIPCGATPSVTVNSPSVCQGASANVVATPLIAGSYTYAWTVPAGFANPGNVATFSTTVPGTYSVIITDTVSGLSSTSASGTVTINALPTVTVNSPTVCGTTATITATPGTPGSYTYTWTVPAGATNPGNTASFSTTISGTYSVEITDLATTCSSATASGIVTINPVPTVTVNSPSVCSGTNATVTATPGVAGTYNYVWTVPAAATNPGNVATFTTATAGTYSVIITDPATTCSSTSASGTVTINALPTVTVNSPTVCGTTATVTATPSPAAGTYSYAWTVPGGATNPGNVASFSATVSGTYSVVVTNTTTTCSSTSASGIATINPVPTVLVNNSSICIGETATVTATPGVAGTYTYTWTVPAGVTNPGNVATFTTTTAGTYSVIITDPTTTCSSTSASGTVTASPAGGALTFFCDNANSTPTNVAFDWNNIAGITSFNYSYSIAGGPVVTGNIVAPTHFNVTTLPYQPVTFTLSPIGSVCVPSQTITCGCPSPIIDAVTNKSACSNQLVNQINFTTADPYDTVSWTNSNPAIGLAPSGTTNFIPSFTAATVATPQTATITVTLTKYGCVGPTRTFTITINPLPTVTVNSSSVCSGTNATVTATPGVAGTYKYVCTVPAGVTNPGNVAIFTITIAGSYSVIITNPTTTCSSASASGTVTVNALPTVTVNTSTVCVGTAATVTATPGVAGTYNYVWTVPSGATNPGNVATFTTTTAGTYSVIITNPTTTCSSASASGAVNNYAVPTVSVNSPSACSGASATVTATPGVAGPYTYTWTVPTGATNPGSVASFTTTTAGTYSVIITNTTTTCSSASASGTVTINALPTVTVSSSSVCTGTNATVTATPGVAGTYNYVWTVPAGVTNPGNVASFTTTTAGNYSVIITNPATTCFSASASGTVTVNSIPTVTVNTSTVCAGTAATVTATPGVAGTYNYAWTVPTGATNPGNVATFATTTAGTYSVIITNPTTTCFSASASGAVNNYAVPTVIVNSPSICSGASATIIATPGVAGPYTYTWTVPTGVTNPGNVASFTTSTPGAYNVIITNTTTTCSSALATGTVTISQTPTVTATPPSDSLCSGQSTGIQLQSNVPNTTFSWTYTQTGGVTGASNSSGNIISQVLTAGTTTGTVMYTITPVSPGSCTGIPTTVTVTVTPVPTVNVNTTAQNICTGDTTNITMTSGIATTTFGWNVVQTGGLTGGTNGTGAAINDVLTASGNTIGQAIYTITPINNGCPGAPKTVTVTVYPTPIATASPTQDTLCSGEKTNIVLNSNVPGTVFNWTVIQTGVFGAASGSGAVISQTLTTVGLTQGTVTYTITPTVNGCPGSPITATVTVNPTPEVFSSTAPQFICSEELTGAGITIYPNIPGTTIEWTVVQSGVSGAADGSASETTPGAGIPINQVLTTTGTTVGTVTYTITPINNGCSGAPITVVVKVNPLPYANIEKGTVCIDAVTGDLVSGYPMETGLNEANYDFQWYFLPNTTDVIGTNSSYTATEAGQYKVKIMNAVTGCSKEFIIDVSESNPAQSATYIVTNYFEDNQAITVIVNGNGIYEYELDHSGEWQLSNVFPHVLPGEHTVAIRDTKGCTDIVLEHIWTIGYPHFFTPNGDGYNETWNISSLKDTQPNAEIHIFDRYGKLIKQIIPNGNGWDGTYNGQLLPSTDYWFTVKFMENGAERIFKAHFSMKR